MTHDLSALVIEGHKTDPLCTCTGCLRKRGEYVAPERAAPRRSERHRVYLTPDEKKYVLEQGGSDYIYGLILKDKTSKEGLPPLR